MEKVGMQNTAHLKRHNLLSTLRRGAVVATRSHLPSGDHSAVTPFSTLPSSSRSVSMLEPLNNITFSVYEFKVLPTAHLLKRDELDCSQKIKNKKKKPAKKEEEKKS